MKLFSTRPFALLVGAALVLGALVALATSPALAQRHATARATAPVKSATAHILVNSKGRTLYVFATDSRNKSACYGQCAKFWPPVLLSKTAKPPSKVAGVTGTFGVATRTDGTRQLTFDGAPLYTFLEDKKAGDMKGQGLFAAGGYWWVVAGGK